MKQCLECGTFSSDDTIFCSVCGKRFSDATDLPAVENNQSENKCIIMMKKSPVRHTRR